MAINLFHFCWHIADFKENCFAPEGIKNTKVSICFLEPSIEY